MADTQNGGGRAAPAEALRRDLADATPDERAERLLALIEADGDGTLRLPALDGARLRLHGLRFSSAVLQSQGLGGSPAWLGVDGQVRLAGAEFRRADLQDADLAQADLTGADFTDTLMRAATLDGTALDTAAFERADLTATSFVRARASQTNFNGAMLEDARFAHATLRFANFTDTLLEGADLASADLWGARLDGAEARGAAFQGGVLREASLVGTDLTGADLQHAKLQGATLTDARLCGANLRGADLSNAKLDGADLTGAELVQVNLLTCQLRHIRLSGAWMERTRLHIAQLGGALGEEVSGDWSTARQGYLDLEQNFRGLGDAESASWCYRRARRMGRRASAATARAAWRGGRWRDALASSTAWASDTFVEWLCDYGESLPRVMRAYLVALGLFTLYYGLSGSLLRSVQTQAGAALRPTPDLVDVLEFSILNMITSSTPDLGLKLASRAVYFVGSLQYVVGIVLIGLFGFVLGNRIRR